MDLVGRDLLALAAAAQDDAAVGLTLRHQPGHVRADRRVVDRLGAVRAAVVDVVTHRLQALDDVLLQLVARVIGADGDAHGYADSSAAAGHRRSTRRSTRSLRLVDGFA